jgi:hypothetical protein
LSEVASGLFEQQITSNLEINNRAQQKSTSRSIKSLSNRSVPS